MKIYKKNTFRVTKDYQDKVTKAFEMYYAGNYTLENIAEQSGLTYPQLSAEFRHANINLRYK